MHWGDVDEGGFRIAAALAREALAVGAHFATLEDAPK